jgi:hypothetical protein
MSGEARHARRCETCFGTGEVGGDFGPAACADCGGAGYLPSQSAFIEWRANDIERVHAAERGELAKDVRWLANELRRARTALVEVLALAQELGQGPMEARIRFVANQALGLYEIVPDEEAPAAKGDTTERE